MPKEAEPSTTEKSYILRALSEGVRLDARSLDATREIEIKFGNDLGVVNLRLGLTRVFTRISAEVSQPFPDRKFDGIFTINTELSPLASPGFEIGRQAEAENLLSRLLEKAVRRSNALDTESLCVVAGQKCWNIRADVHVLDYDGGLIDASCISVIAALQHFRRPDVTVEGEKVKIHDISDRVPVPLALLHHPYCITLSFFLQGSKVVVDATLREQQVSEGEMVVTITRHGEICQIAKLGGVPTDAVLLLHCVEIASAKVITISKQVSDAVATDLKKRMGSGIISESTADNEI